MAQYGEATVDIWAARSVVLTLANTPIPDSTEKLWAVVQGAAGSAPGIAQGALKVQAGVVAWARFTYSALRRIALVLTKRILGGNLVNTQDAWQITLNTLYDLQSDYESIVIDRMQSACAGLRLMFGIDNPLAKVLYHGCMTHTNAMHGLYKVAMDIFVVVPMATCVCRDAINKPLGQYAMETCVPKLPVSLVPTLYMIVNQASNALPRTIPALRCNNVIQYLQSRLNTSMDAYFDHANLAIDATASLIDYMVISFDKDAGQCLDYIADPHVVVIVPNPTDYFVKCAQTSICKSRCSNEWQAFAARQASPIRLPDYEVGVESMFFPGTYDVALELSSALAITEVDWFGKCTERQGQQDFALAIAQLVTQGVMLQYWCAPVAPGISVYASSTVGTTPQPVPGGGVIITSHFGSSQGDWLVALIRVGESNSVHVLSSTGWQRILSLADLDGPTVDPVSIVNVWPFDGVILADVAFRQSVGTTDPVSTAYMQHYYFEYRSNYTRWTPTNIDLSIYGGSFWLSRLGTGFNDQYMLIPQKQGLSALSFKIQISYGYERGLTYKSAPTPLTEAGVTSYLDFLQDHLLSTFSRSNQYILAVRRSGWDWLRQVRLTGSAITGVYQSTRVNTVVRGQHGRCDGTGCEGCPDLLTNRLCLAYSSCSLINCVGTPVHQRRPLCGIGHIVAFSGRMTLLSVHGGYTILVEVFMQLLQASLSPNRRVDIAFPEDTFMCYVCTAKDRSAHFFSVITSTVNAALAGGDANVGYMFGGASDVDTNADAMITLTTTSINSFFQQVAMWLIYSQVVAHQTMMCQLNGVLAIFDPAGVTIRLQSAALANSSDIVAGRCLTKGEETTMYYPELDTKGVVQAVGGMVENRLQLALVKAYEPAYHIIDGTLAYIIGILQSIGNLVKSQNLATCNPPNFVLEDIVQCACGDTELTIPPSLDPEYALWCTGTLAMVDSNNRPFVVYNPYSFQRLQEINKNIQQYVECRSSTAGHSCSPPRDFVFDQQGVTALNVLVKCRENYMRQRWDPAAHILFNRSLYSTIKYSVGLIQQPIDLYGVGACLRLAFSSGTDNEACLDMYLEQRVSIDWDEYWSYSIQRIPGAQYRDACVTFSGPAAKGIAAFVNCSDDSASDTCALPGHCWAPASYNDHPVCYQHTVRYSQEYRDTLVQRLFAKAHTLVQNAVNTAIGSWNTTTPPIQVDFFSTEGDLIHQTMDCIFMGPYARVDYWAIPQCTGGQECLKGPYWSRDTQNGKSRNVDITTCESESTPPYTCGSPARQSLMRYFVNNLIAGGTGSNGSAIQLAVLAHIRDVWANWANQSNYTSPDLLPEHLQNPYFEIKDEHVLQSLLTDFGKIWDIAGQSASAWTTHLYEISPQEIAAYNWSASERARDEALFDPVTPRYAYATQEAASPMIDNEHTLWDLCHGAIKQVFFTMPVNQDGGLRFGINRVNGSILSSTLNFDALPYSGDPAELEQYIQAISQEAFLHSPMFRHYHPAHAPTDSQMCDRPPRQGPPPPADTLKHNDYVQAGTKITDGKLLPDIPVQPFTDFTIGENTCLCGWPSVGSGVCQVPDLNTRDLVCAIVPCQNGAYNRSDEPTLEAQFSPSWVCPQTQTSFHWGLADPDATEAWFAGNSTITTSTRDLLQHGRSGFRIGSIRKLLEDTKSTINPSTRQLPLDHARIRTCRYQDRLVNRSDLADEFVQELFPMAHGVEDSGVAAYCSRYVIENARLAALALLLPDSIQYAEQTDRVSLWRTRCGSQVRVLSMCVNLDIFRPLVRYPENRKLSLKECTHFQPFDSDPRYAKAYSTSECLVNIDGTFYDPCRCMDCTGAGVTLNLRDITTNPACAIRFDPR